MKKKIINFISSLMVMSMLVGCGAASNEPSISKTDTTSNSDKVEAEITLKFSHQMAENHSMNTTVMYFADLVKEKSNGTMVIDVYPSATLGTEAENLQSLTNGTLDMALIAAEFYANYVDEAGILCLPYMYEDYEDAYTKLNSPGGDKVEEMVLNETNVKILDFYVPAFRQIFTVDKKINSVEDMKGLIIRVPDSVTYRTTFGQFGASPTPVSWGETYTALDTGVVEAVENIPESIMSASMQEVCKNVNVTNHIISPSTLSISNEIFEKLTEEQQNILIEAAEEACLFGKNKTIENSEANFNSLKDSGLTVIETNVESMKNSIDYSAYTATQTEAGKEILSMLEK